MNRKANFLAKRIDSNRFAWWIESIRIANWNALLYGIFSNFGLIHAKCVPILPQMKILSKSFGQLLLLLLLLLLHPLNGLFSRKTWVSRYQKDKTSLDLNEARVDGVLKWQWHQLDHMQAICTSLQTNNHTNTFYRQGALPDAQPTVSKHWRHSFGLMF